MIGTAVRQVIAIDGSDNDVIKPEVFYNQSDVARFFGVQCQRFAFVDGAKTAAARTGITQDQEGRSFVAPAFTDIRAACLLANRVKIFLPQDALQAKIVGVARRFDFDPVGMSSGHFSSFEDGGSMMVDRDLRSSILHLRPFQSLSSRTVQRSG